MEDSMEIPLKTSNKTTMFCAVLSRVQLFATPWTIALQAPLSMGFSRQEYWSVLPFPTPGDLPNPGIEPASLASPVLAGGFFNHCARGFSVKLPYDPIIPLLCIYPEKVIIEKDTYIPMFTAALFTIARTWKQPRCHQQMNG